MTRPPMAHFETATGEPQTHGAKRIGVRPRTELIHTVAATGERPLVFTAKRLPKAFTLDPDTGIISGIAPATAKTIKAEITVTNRLGAVTTPLEIVVGDRLALTPPMGWNSWNMYAREVDAEIVRRVADGMVSSGMRDLGYSYINIDDHWHAAQRGPNGEPVADPVKFPDGIAAVADYVHERGLKLGIYSDAAERTCGGCFGGYLHEQIDAEHYAAWGIDLLKYDYCHAPQDQRSAITRYRAMSEALQSVNRSIVFSVCEWGFRRPWEWAPQIGASMWRSTPDIFDTFSWGIFGVRGIAHRNMKLAEYAGPGQWNDPDMLIVGNHGEGQATGSMPLRPPDSWRVSLRGVGDVEAHTHMSLWAMMAAPLLTSIDLADMATTDRDMLMNPHILAINQDVLGQQARVVSRRRRVWVLRKQLTGGRQAVSFTNWFGGPVYRSLSLASLGLHGAVPVLDAWTGRSLGTLDRIDVHLDRHSTRVFIVGGDDG